MNQISFFGVVCLIVGVAISAVAQTNEDPTKSVIAKDRDPVASKTKQSTTNAPVTMEQVHARLKAISDRIVALDKRARELHNYKEDLFKKKLDLQLTVGKITGKQHRKLLEAEIAKRQAELGVIWKQLAALELQEMEIRERYVIPKDDAKPTAPRRRKQ